jgi:hypothetical protein
LGYWNEQEAPKDGSSTGQLGDNQEKTRLRSETSANDETKPNMEKGLEEVAAEKNKGPEVKTEIRIEARTSSRCLPNWAVRYPKPGHSILAASGQRRTSTTAPGTTPTPH